MPHLPKQWPPLMGKAEKANEQENGKKEKVTSEKKMINKVQDIKSGKEVYLFCCIHIVKKQLCELLMTPLCANLHDGT